MSKRKVFGRIELVHVDQPWKVELRPDGVHLRKKHHRMEWHLGIATLVRLCAKQPELFVIREVNVNYDDKLEGSQPAEPVPGVPQDPLVRGDDGSRALHASAQQPPQTIQNGGDGVDTQGRDSGGAANEKG